MCRACETNIHGTKIVDDFPEVSSFPFDTIISTNKNIIVERFDNCSTALLSLKVDKLDATMFDKVTCEYYLKYDKNIRMLKGLNYPKEDYGIAVSKENTDLLNDINQSLKQIMTNGFYEYLIQKYF